MKIAIRADGGSTIGMGHIMRTLVLAKELAKTNYVFYVCRDGKKYLGGINKIKESGFDVVLINEYKVLEELRKITADMLITDSYYVNEEYFSNSKLYFEKTIYLDDLNDKYYDVDMIINQNIGAESWKYKANDNCELLLGCNYTMLREEFRYENPIKIKDKVVDVLITMGGADPLGATKKILDMLKNLDLRLHIVIGNNFKDIDYYKILDKQEDDKIKFYYNPNMIKVMKKCDMAIVACGSTIYELASLGIPMLGVVVAENQERVASISNEKEILINMGYINKLKKEKLIMKIQYIENFEVRAKLHRNQLKQINKNGVLNIVNKVLESE